MHLAGLDEDMRKATGRPFDRKAFTEASSSKIAGQLRTYTRLDETLQKHTGSSGKERHSITQDGLTIKFETWNCVESAGGDDKSGTGTGPDNGDWGSTGPGDGEDPGGPGGDDSCLRCGPGGDSDDGDPIEPPEEPQECDLDGNVFGEAEEACAEGDLSDDAPLKASRAKNGLG